MNDFVVYRLSTAHLEKWTKYRIKIKINNGHSFKTEEDNVEKGKLGKLVSQKNLDEKETIAEWKMKYVKKNKIKGKEKKNEKDKFLGGEGEIWERRRKVKGIKITKEREEGGRGGNVIVGEKSCRRHLLNSVP